MSIPTLPKPKAVIFDWDNTLVDTWPIIHEALHQTFVARGLRPWTMEEVVASVRKSMRDSFPEVFGPNWEEAAEIYQGHYRANQGKLKALEGAEEVIKAVKDAGLISVVVSNKKGVNLRREVENLGWGKYFDAIVGADDAARDKPFADPVLHAFKDLGIKPGEDVWFIGDSEVDLECAKNTGCVPLLFGTLVIGHAQYDLASRSYHGFDYAHHYHEHVELKKTFESLKA